MGVCQEARTGAISPKIWYNQTKEGIYFIAAYVPLYHTSSMENAMSEDIDLPRWVIRRYAVVKDRKVDKFETLAGATAHRQKNGGEIRELIFRLSEIKAVTPRVEGWVRADGA